MKKCFCVIAIAVFLLSLCSCGEKTFERSIGEMSFTIIDDLTEETDIKAVRQNFVDSESVTSKKEAKEMFLDCMWFYNNDCDLAVSARYMPYNNNDIDSCIDNAYVKESKYTRYEDVKNETLKGKLIQYEMDGCVNDCLLILNNGIFYEFSLTLQDGVEYPENYLEDIASSISFDSENLRTKKASCGEVEFEIPVNYQELDFEATADTYNEQWYGQYGERYVEFGCFNCMESEWGSISDIFDGAALDGQERTSKDFSLGTCEYLTGTDDESSFICAAFEYNGKIYVFQMFFTETPDKQDIFPIINSIKAKD